MPENPGLTMELTAEIVSAHVSKNEISAEALPALIQNIYTTLASAGNPTIVETLTPAVPIKKSIFPDYLICLEDGKHLKMLKRHLEKKFGLTPAQYREKWNLPRDYPMVAPNYTEHRSKLAKQTGLGTTKPTVAETAAETKPTFRAASARVKTIVKKGRVKK